MSAHKRKWLVQAPLGLVLIGFGLCLVIEAAFYKHAGAAVVNWVGYGTLALIIFNSGISVFGNAVVHKVHYDRTKKTEKLHS